MTAGARDNSGRHRTIKDRRLSRCFPHHLPQRISQPQWPLEAVWKTFHQLLAQRIRILVAEPHYQSVIDPVLLTPFQARKLAHQLYATSPRLLDRPLPVASDSVDTWSQSTLFIESCISAASDRHLEYAVSRVQCLLWEPSVDAALRYKTPGSVLTIRKPSRRL